MTTKTTVKITFDIEEYREAGQVYYTGKIREYPGLISEGKSPTEVRKNLRKEFNDILQHHPEELESFQ